MVVTDEVRRLRREGYIPATGTDNRELAGAISRHTARPPACEIHVPANTVLAVDVVDTGRNSSREVGGVRGKYNVAAGAVEAGPPAVSIPRDTARAGARQPLRAAGALGRRRRGLRRVNGRVRRRLDPEVRQDAREARQERHDDHDRPGQDGHPSPYA